MASTRAQVQRLAYSYARRPGVGQWPRPGQRVSYEKAREMRRHPTIALARAFYVAPIISSHWSISVKDGARDEWGELVRENVFPFREKLLSTAIGASVDYGWTSWELVWEYMGDKEIVTQCKPLLVDITKILVGIQTGTRVGVHQWPLDGRAEIELYGRNKMIASFRPEGDDWYGQPIMDNLVLPYADWLDAQSSAARYDRRLSGPLLRIGHPIGASEIQGEMRDNFEIATEIGNNWEAMLPLIHPVKGEHTIGGMSSDSGSEWQFELLGDSATRSGSMIARMEYADKLFARGMLSPERSLLEGSHGTLAEAESHADSALMMREEDHRRFLDELNEQFVDNLLLLNFGPQAVGKVRIKPAVTDRNAIAFMREVYKLLATNPLTFSTIARGLDIDAITDEIGLPKLKSIMDSAEVPPSAEAMLKAFDELAQ